MRWRLNNEPPEAAKRDEICFYCHKTFDISRMVQVWDNTHEHYVYVMNACPICALRLKSQENEDAD